MRFTRKPGTKFFLPDGGSPDGICLYAPFPQDQNTIDLGTKLADATAFFLIIFFKEGTVIGGANLDDKLDSVMIGRKRRIYWLDEFTAQAVEGAPVLEFNARNEAPSFGKINQGSDASDFNVEIGSRQTRGRVSFANDTFVVETASRGIVFNAHSSQTSGLSSNALFSSMSIPLAGDKQGSLNFKTEGTNANTSLIQPVAPYIGRSHERYAVEFFDRASFSGSVELNVTYFPYSLSTNDLHRYTSFIKFVPRTGGKVMFQLPSENGLNYVVKKFGEDFQANLVRVEYVNSDEPPRYFFIPEGTVLLSDAGDNAAHMLVGNSGTEMLPAQSAITFKRDKRLKVKEDETGLKESGNSVTSFISLAAEQVLYLDAQRSPAFGNPGPKTVVRTKPPGGNDAAVIAVETPYAPVPLARVKGPVPMVPIFSLKHDPRLVNLEKVFSVVRKEASKPPSKGRLAGGSYVTPQGFLRTGNDLDLIAKSTRQRRGRDAAPAGSNYQFEVGPVDPDFNVSITKEDVFFVTTPKLMRDANSPAMIRAFFAMGDFKVDLMPLPEDKYTPTNTEKIIIFKFSRSSFDDLLKDTTRWSNWGRYSSKNPKIDLAKIANSIGDYINKFPKEADYAYFNEVIRKSSEWNGIVILNVPIANAGQLPDVFKGLSASQTLQPNETSEDKLPLKTGLTFQYVAFPINKTETRNTGSIGIKSTSFYGLIDYDLLKDRKPDSDYGTVSGHFTDLPTPEKLAQTPWKFLLTKLMVRFENSNVASFSSFAFLQLPSLFENGLMMDKGKLTHKKPDTDTGTVSRDNLIRLEGFYQKNANGDDEFAFSVETNITCAFRDNPILRDIVLSKVSFSYVKGAEDSFRFDLDAEAHFNSEVDTFKQMINFESIKFEGIGLKFPLIEGKLPQIKFDVSRLFVLPKITFDGKGFLRSFPVRFNRFQAFKLGKLDLPGSIHFDEQNFDFFKIYSRRGSAPSEAILWGLIFDFDLGTLGDLELLKSLKGEILFGWTAGGGFKLGLRLAPRASSLHVDLFGALKLDIDHLAFCSFETDSGGGRKDTRYFLRLVNARLTIMDVKLPPEKFDFNAIIFAKPGSRVAWFMAATQKASEKEPSKLLLGMGQRVGLKKSLNAGFTKVEECIKAIKQVFEVDGDPCRADSTPVKFYEPESNWLIASDSILPDSLKNILSLQFVFNDPVLYGIHLGVPANSSSGFAGFAIDIIYKKLSDNLGVWSLEIQLPNAIRNIEMGGAAVTLPNIGVEIYTDGGWRVDIGFPKGEDFSRSCLVQVRPFVGWAGLYMMKTSSASLTLFRGVIPNDYSNERLTIVQAGFALRLGLGAYIDKGIFFAGASISAYGILEGAFAFEKGDTGGLSQLFPNHFALQGRFGVIAEIIGYVEFSIVKAAVYIVLSQEVGVLLIYLDRPINNFNAGLQPVTLYIKGSVSVSVEVTIACFKIFRRKFCIKVRFSFSATIQFQYTLGRSSSPSRGFLETALSLQGLADEISHPIAINNVQEIPVTYMPGFTKTGETSGGALRLVHNFAIPFFAKTVDGGVVYTKNNIIRRLVENIFSGLIAGLPAGVSATYENLRSILLTGRVAATGGQSYKVEITFPQYRPWFIVGHNLGNPADEVFEKFGFNATEADAFVQELKKERNPFRLMPAPISTSILVSDGSLSQKPRPVTGFEIEITNIVKKGTETTISCPIKELKFTLAGMKKFESFFDHYKTQFMTRPKTRLTKKALDEELLLRQTFVISEYFKLVALLTLESYFNFGLKQHREAKDRTKEDIPYNPVIDALQISSNEDDSAWKLNEHLEDIVGQLNYFYNSGLRLPDVKSAEKEPPTKAYFELLEQSSEYTAVSDRPVDEARVVLKDGTRNGVDLTKELFLRQVFRVTGADALDTDTYLEFKKGIEESIKVDLADLSRSFAAAEMKPFELLPIRLALQNDGLRVRPTGADNPQRFFTLPEKLRKAEGEHRVSLVYIERRDVEKPQKEYITRRAAACVIVEMKVRPHGMKNRKARVIEIANVDIDNLSVMNLLRGVPAGRFRRVRLYQRNQAELAPLSSPTTTIIKTNLSTETHPPLIGRAAPQDTPLDYIAESNDVVNFTRLLWEGVTTNNSGYYFLLDREYEFADPTPGQPVGEYTVALSFELEESTGDVSEAFPSFCNYLKVTDAKAGSTPPPIFGGLDDNSHYLYLEVFTTRDEDGRPVPLREYHAKMPAHCFGFELSRPKTIAGSEGAAYSHYLPLEFDLRRKGAADFFLNKNRVLPLMPAEDDRKDADPTRLFYKHVTPLRADNDPANPDPHNKGRYSVVGEEYQLTFGLRDIYGFRAADLKTADGRKPVTLNYKHPYFDKLVPVDSWPLLRFSYWFESYNDRTKDFVWKLTCALDAKGLTSLVGLRDQEAVRGSVSEAAMMEAAGALESILNDLYTVQAQLEDARAVVAIPGFTASNDVKKFLQSQVDKAIKQVEQFATGRRLSSLVPSSESLLLTRKYPDFRTPLAVRIEIERNGYWIGERHKDMLFADVLEYKSVKSTSCDVKLEKLKRGRGRATDEPPPPVPTVKDLDAEITDATKDAYCLGLSSDASRAKVIYLLSKETLKKVALKKPPTAAENYLGIKPYSNHLWSGTYSPSPAGEGPETRFSNVDLDTALRVVLSKVDELLAPASILEHALDTRLIDHLIGAKKALADDLSARVANVKETATPPSAFLFKRFKNLLLERLSNFYDYDGIIGSGVDVRDAALRAALENHRLTITFDKHNDPPARVEKKNEYNVVSSKISKIRKDNDDAEWVILFDRLQEEGRISLDLIPQITHLEFGIKEGVNTDIESSTWIQLVKPVALAGVKTDNWPRIVRRFPPKPVIKRQTATQSQDDQPGLKWDKITLGAWQYEVAIEDSYIDGDELEIILHTVAARVARLLSNRSREGFIAYWADQITAEQGAKFNWADFARDLSLQFTSKRTPPKPLLPAGPVISVVYRKGNDGKTWQRESFTGLPASSFWPTLTASDNELRVPIKGLNIFSETRIISVNPDLKVYRNRTPEVSNTVFHYQTEAVSPPTWATPQIRFYNEIKRTGMLQGVLEDVAETLPYKATAKLVLDIGNIKTLDEAAPAQPFIPVRQMEFTPGVRPDPPVDSHLPSVYQNGWPAISLTIYNKKGSESDLPIFHAELVKKDVMPARRASSRAGRRARKNRRKD